MEEIFDISYYILRRQLFKITQGEVIPEAWHRGSWVKSPFAFEVEQNGHRVSEEEALVWMRDHLHARRVSF